ncbi:MAG: hypothetical protein AAFY05_14245 [Pseudomonadota bacterium]
MIASIFFITLFLSPNYMPDMSAGSFLADDLKASAPVHRRKPMKVLKHDVCQPEAVRFAGLEVRENSQEKRQFGFQ